MLLKSFVKRSLAFVLCMVMLVSCWVFTAPTASAAVPPTSGFQTQNGYILCPYDNDATKVYHIEIDLHVINAANGYDRTFKGTRVGNPNNNWTWNAEDYKDQGGVVLWYKDNNGTASEEKAHSFGIGFNDYKYLSNNEAATIMPKNDYQDYSGWFGSYKGRGDTVQWDDKYYTLYSDISGFPTSFAVYNHNDNDLYADWEVTQVRVYAYDSSVNFASGGRYAGSNGTAIFSGSVRTKHSNGEACRYKIDYNANAYQWNPNGMGSSMQDTGYNWVHYSAFNSGEDAMNRTTQHLEYAIPWQMPAPPEVPSYSYTKTFSDSSLEDTYRYVAPEHATNNFAYNTQNVRDQYGALLSGTVSTDFIISDYRLYNGSSLIPNPNPYTDTLSISSTGEITPIKANSYAYHNLTVYPQVTWAPGAGIASQTFDGASTKVGLTFPEYTLNYTYNQQNLGDAAPEFDPDDYVTEFIPSGYTENTLGATQTALYGDLPASASVPAAEQSSYFDSEKHYTGTWSLPASGLSANPTVQAMAYSAGTAHSWSGTWSSYSGIVNGFSSAEFHRDSCSVNGTHYKYQAHNWEKENGNIVWRTEIAGEHAGEHYKKCTSCNYIAYGSHDYNSVTTDPTCTADGYITHTCDTCAYSYVEYPYTESGNADFKALGHAPGVDYYSDGSNHWRICGRAGCGVKIDDSGAVGQSGHSLDSGVVTTQPTCTTEGVKTFTCTVCGNTSNTTSVAALGHSFTDTSVRNETTRKVAPTCTTDGEYYYGCSRCDAISHNIEGVEDMSFIVSTEGETGYRLGHDWGDVKSYQAGDKTPGYTYYECSGCEKFCAADYDVTKNSYEADESTIYNEQSSVEANSDKIPDPYFNDGGSTAMFYEGIDYSTRPASFRYDTSEDSQTIRFAGSVKVPAGVSWQVGTQSDNVITDFGFVYTQTKYICDYNSETGKYIDGSNPNPSKLYYDASKIAVKGEKGYKIYQMSVLDNSGDISHIYNGFSHHQVSSSGGTADYLTFNLVIGVNVGNWGKEYAARPYITYKYHGLTYTVYDGGASNTTDENMQYSHRSVTDLAEDIMYFDPFDEVFAKSMKYDYGLDYNGYKALVQNYKEDKAYALNRYFESRMDKAAFEALVEEKINDDPWWTLAIDIEDLLDNPEFYDVNWYNGRL